MLNVYNAHMWYVDKPYRTRTCAAQQHFTVHVWLDIEADSLLGPCILSPWLHSSKYLAFLQDVLPEMLNDVPAHVRRGMGFQHDGRHQITQGAHMTIWTGYLEKNRLGITIPSLALPLQITWFISSWIFLLGCHEEHATKFWIWPGRTNVPSWCYWCHACNYANERNYEHRFCCL